MRSIRFSLRPASLAGLDGLCTLTLLLSNAAESWPRVESYRLQHSGERGVKQYNRNSTPDWAVSFKNGGEC